MGKKIRKERQLTSVSLICLLSLVSRFALGLKPFLVIYRGLIRNNFKSASAQNAFTWEKAALHVKIPWNAPLEGRGTFAIQLGNSHKTYSSLSAGVISSLGQVAFTEDSTFRGTGARVTSSVIRQ